MAEVGPKPVLHGLCDLPVSGRSVATGCSTGQLERGHEVVALHDSACEACVPPQKTRVPDLPAVYRQAKQRASEYCAKMNRAMVQTGGGFDIGTGLNVTFRCVP